MLPIPKFILTDNAVLVTEYSPDIWGNPTEQSCVPLECVRIEPCRATAADKNSQQIILSAKLYFDCVNSSSAVPFYLEGDTDTDGKTVRIQRVKWNGRDYTVKTIRPFSDCKKIHYYEVGLV